jgi:excisionase family DNA binding protein
MTTAPPARLIDVRTVASLLNCSPRHVFRLCGSGRLPAPVKLGGLVRWSRDEIESWIAGGCKPVGPPPAA